MNSLLRQLNIKTNTPAIMTKRVVLLADVFMFILLGLHSSIRRLVSVEE